MVGRAHHDHMYCISCGKVIEFEEEAIERLQEMVTQRHRFTAVYHSHKIFGYCAACGGPKPPPKGGRS
jgi:Fur family transcriptional regulator, ferric uptake regulator